MHFRMNLFWKCAFFAMFAVLQTIACMTNKDYSMAETFLIKNLTDAKVYEKNARPANSDANFTEIGISVFGSNVVHINDKEQEFGISVYLVVKWKDERLCWNATEYGVTNLQISSSRLWIPDLGLLNSLDSTEYDMSQKRGYFIDVSSDGWLLWLPGSEIKAGCKLDMTNFPFDAHKCALRFGSWAQSAKYIRLRADKKVVGGFALEIESNEWEITKSVVYDELYRPNELLDGWSRVWAIMSIKRKPRFYVINILVPCIALSCLVLMVFYTPSESGEKVSLGITVLLAFSVFQLVMADILPSSSDSTPVIVVYLTTLLITSVFSTILAVVVLNMHNMGGSKEMPQWLRSIVFGCLSRLVCIGKSKKKDKPEKKNSLKNQLSRYANDITTVCQSGVNLTRIGSLRSSKVRDAVDDPKPPEQVPKQAELTVIELLREKRQKREKKEAEEREECLKNEWITAGRIIDRFLMIIYFVVYVTLTVTCIFVLPHHHTDNETQY